MIDVADGIASAVDVLSAEIPIEISGVAGHLLFPHCPKLPLTEDRSLAALLPPPVAATWKQGERLLHWGRLKHSGTLASDITRLLLVFQLPPDRLRSDATRIRRGYAVWWTLFNEYLELVTRQRRQNSIWFDQDAASLDLFRWVGNKIDRPYDEPTGQMTITTQGDHILLTRAQADAIAELASRKVELSSELKIQLEGYRALQLRDYRKAIIEAAAAAELSLTRLIQEQFNRDRVSYGERLLAKFRMLGGRLELARIVGVQLPDVDLQKALVEPRNEVIHKANFASEINAREALDASDFLLERLWPQLPWSIPYRSSPPRSLRSRRSLPPS